jgi:hypothetical protein
MENRSTNDICPNFQIANPSSGGLIHAVLGTGLSIDCYILSFLFDQRRARWMLYE